MGLFKQLMIFGKTGLQGLPTRVTLSLWVFRSPYSQHGILWQARGESQYLETFRAGTDPGIILSALVAQLVGRLGSDGFWERDYAILAHAEGVLYGTELGSVTLKRVSLFCFPIKHSTHTVGIGGTFKDQVDL